VVPHLLAACHCYAVHGETPHLREAGRNAGTTKGGEVANSGAPPVLAAFGDYDAMRLRQFASVHGGALVEKWQLFGATSLFSEAAE